MTIGEYIRQHEHALSFAASVIKSGEPWTDECEILIGQTIKLERPTNQELNRVRLLRQALGEVLKKIGVLGDCGLTGPELLCAAETYLKD